MQPSKQAIARFRAMTKNVRTTTTIGLFFCTISAVGLFVASFFWPPTGTIDPSVIKAAGYCFAFAGVYWLREAVLEGMGIKLTHGETTIEVHDLDGKIDENGKDND